MEFDQYFDVMTSGLRPRDWQRELAADEQCTNRTVRIPTGFGKTLGIAATWLWHRTQRNDDRWPRRLVWCLPMRVLAEQTAEEIRTALDNLNLLWDASGDHTGKIGVHVLMGGSEPGAWHQHPEHSAVIIGTQDMLLSRALNRGYAAPRARWPMDFGLLNHDCLWVMDEVQLMDVGLATSAQLQAFRDGDGAASRGLRPCRTWWMSATLQPGWLAKSPDTRALTAGLGATEIPPAARNGPLWDDVAKPCAQVAVQSPKALAAVVRDRHLAAGRGAGGPTLIVLNTVDRAIELWQALARDLAKNKALAGTDLRLIHSRFRPHERAGWTPAFLNRAACTPGSDRIIVATQVIEAGVDLSAGLLITELAPWASLVQRFGRCARWGGRAKVVVVQFESLKSAAPYEQEEINAAHEALNLLGTEAGNGQADVAPRSLVRFEEEHPDLLPALYPFEPKRLLLRHELDELFDTTPDLSGADVDISRFIRGGDERDLYVFWADIAAKQSPEPSLRPARDALCAVPFLHAQRWLCDKGEKLAAGRRAWIWDWQDGTWRRPIRGELYPGQTVLIAADTGGYDPQRGFAPDSDTRVPPVPAATLPPEAWTDSAQDDETLSEYAWKTIATHGRETGATARTIAKLLAPDLAELFDLAGRWHDAGKVHPAFRCSIIGDPQAAPRDDLAKAPAATWRTRSALYLMPDGSRRPGLRHELASTLALFGVLQRHDPDHPALLGPWRELIDTAGLAVPARPAVNRTRPPSPLEREVLALGADEFDLVAYLVCAHHGKLRFAWHAGKADQSANDTVLRIRGIRDGERLPPLPLVDAAGQVYELPETLLDLSPAAAGISASAGAGWTDRVLGLLERLGPFTLAWLEALLRAADQRASQLDAHDPLITTPHGQHLCADQATAPTKADNSATQTAATVRENGQ
jgi:CRISPR-associated endonuclease/helicase Cas3